MLRSICQTVIGRDFLPVQIRFYCRLSTVDCQLFVTMQLSKSTQTSLSEINMVPFVDVVLVLLVIFMIAAPILQSGIEVDVPKTRTVKDISQDRLVVTIDKAQRVYLGNDPVNFHQLGPRVHPKLRASRQAVFLRCDETAPFGSFAASSVALRQS